jgi:2-C-methyl-D-erythritol 4-phosphate cytidylyltransferase
MLKTQDFLPEPRVWALIPCAGSGSRAQSTGPKQYQMLAGQPMVLHTLDAFAQVQRIAAILVVVAPDDSFFSTLHAQNQTPPGQKPSSYWVAPCGGASRAMSVQNGLNHLLAQEAKPNDWVLVHDAARCLIEPAQIDALIEACQGDAVGGLLALRLPDTLKCEQAGRVGQTLDRRDKWLAQTPQMFRIGALSQALQSAGTGVTDESSAMEHLGLHPLLVDGSAQNIKVTYQQDFALAEAILYGRKRRTRQDPEAQLQRLLA